MPTPTFGHLNAPRGAVQSQNWVWDSGLLDWVPETQPGGSSGGSGVVVDGVDATIKATVKDYTNSNPLAVVTVDVNGDPVTAGGGTQYAEDTVSTAGELVTMAGVVRKDVRASLVGADGDRTELQVDANGDLRVRVASDGSPIGVFAAATFPVLISGSKISGTVSGIGIASDLQVDEGAGVGALYVTNTGAFVGTLRMVGEVNGTHQLMNQLYNVTDSTVDTTVQFNKIYMFPIGGLRTCALYATAYTSGNCDYELGGGVGSINIPIGTQPVSAASLPLPAGAATSAKQDTLLTELQLKADLTETQPVSLASVPSHAVTLASTTITGSVAVTGPLTDTQLRATPVPVSGTVTANAGTNLNTSALSLEATQLLVKAKTDNLDVALSTRLKPADTLAAVTAITNVVHVDDNAGSLTVDNPNLDVALSTRLKPADTLAAVTTLGTITNVVHVDDNAGSLTVDGSVSVIKTDLTPSAPTTAVVGVASASAVAAQATRKGLILRNTSTTSQRISLGFGSAAVLDSGITLYPQDAYCMNEYDFDTSVVNAIASAASASLAIQEYLT